MNILEILKERKQILKMAVVALTGAATVYMVPAHMSSAMMSGGDDSEAIKSSQVGEENTDDVDQSVSQQTTLEKLDAEIVKTKTKIAELQERLSRLKAQSKERKKTEVVDQPTVASEDNTSSEKCIDDNHLTDAKAAVEEGVQIPFITDHEIFVDGKGRISCDKNYDNDWLLSFKEDGYTETESCKFSTNDDFDLKKFFIEASATFTKANTVSLADLVSADPNLTLTGISVRREKGALSCDKNYDNDWLLSFKEDGYIETESCKFSTNDDFDFKQFFSEAFEQFSSTDTFSVKDFVSSNPNLTFKEISLKEKGTLSCYKNDNGDWSLTFKKDYYTDPESCTFSADDDFDLKNFFSAAVNKFCSEESFSVKDFARSNPILKLKLSNEEMKKIETEFGLKILEDLPTGDKTDLEKFLELPQKSDLSEHEQNIYDQIEAVVKTLMEKADKDTSDISKQLKIAKAIYEWVANNITYIDKKQESAFEVFENKCGICRGYSHLTNLMMRIAGIPSLYIGSLNSNTDEKGHAFNAVYISDDTPERSGWTVLDSTWAAPKFTDGICEQNLFEQNESDSVPTLNEKFKDLIDAANENIPWGYEEEITNLLKSKTAIIEKNNIDQINEELSKQLSEINSKPEYEGTNGLSEIKIEINSDDKVTSEETKDHFLSRLRLTTTLSDDAKQSLTQKNQGKLQKYFPTAYNHNISCKDANKQILSIGIHSIERLSTEIYDIDLSKYVYPYETETGLAYYLAGHEEDAYIFLFGNPENTIFLENVEISQEFLSFGLPIKIGSGVKSLILQGNEEVDISEARDLENVEIKSADKYVLENGIFYKKNPDGTKGEILGAFAQNSNSLKYKVHISEDKKNIEYVEVYSDDYISEPVDLSDKLPEDLCKLKIKIGKGISTLVLHDEEVDISEASDLEIVNTDKSSKYVCEQGALFERASMDKWQLLYGMTYKEVQEEDGSIRLQVFGGLRCVKIKIPEVLLTKYRDSVIEIYAGIETLILQGDEKIDIRIAWGLKNIDTTRSSRYIAEDGFLYERKDGGKGEVVGIFDIHRQVGDIRYIICASNDQKKIKKIIVDIYGKILDLEALPPEITKYNVPIEIRSGVRSLKIKGDEEVELTCPAIEEVDVSESNKYILENGVLYEKKDGKRGDIAGVISEWTQVGDIRYFILKSDDNKKITKIIVDSKNGEPLDIKTLPPYITKYNVPIKIGPGIRSLKIKGDEEVELIGSDIQKIDVSESNRYIFEYGVLYEKKNGKKGDIVKVIDNFGLIGNIAYGIYNGRVRIESGNDSIQILKNLPPELTKYNMPIEIRSGIGSLKIKGDEEIKLFGVDLEDIDVSESNRYIVEDGVLYKKDASGNKGVQISVFHKEVDKGEYKYFIKPLNTILICGNGETLLEDFHIPQELFDQYYRIEIGPGIESLVLEGKQKVSCCTIRAKDLKEVDLSKSEIYKWQDDVIRSSFRMG